VLGKNGERTEDEEKEMVMGKQPIGRSKRTTPILMCALLLFAVGGASFVDADPMPSIDRSISKAVAYLQDNQLRHGEFKTYVSPDSTMRRILHFDSSPFVTTFVVYSLAFVDDPRTPEMTKRALDFLQGEEDRAGVWRYWTSLNDKRIDPDLDDMACISFLLRRYGRRFGANHEIIYANRNNQGLFYTWIRDPHSSEPNDIDCVVNANVLLYLGENSRTRAACTYVNDVIQRNVELENSVYYVDDSAVYYCVSRAFKEGVGCFDASRDSMIARTLRTQNPNGSWGDELATGFSLCTLFNLDAPDSTTLEHGISYLLKRQQFLGSWPNAAFYIARSGSVRWGSEALTDASVWWGSEALTTAICCEALARYIDWLLSQPGRDQEAGP
jgi:hypothetical protein